MPSHKVHFKVDLTVHEGKLAAFEETAKAMIAASLKEPGAVGYEWHLSRDRTQCRLLETYADANAVLAHLTGPTVQQLVPKLLESSSMGVFEVYGDPGTTATEMLEGFGAKIFPHWRGLGKLGK